MSRIGKQPIPVDAGVKVSVKDNEVLVEGKLGKLSYKLPGGITAKVEEGNVIVTRADETRQEKALHGLARTLVHNMIIGVAKGYGKSLEIEGVGFKAALKGKVLSLSLGFASPKEYKIPEGANITVSADGLKIDIKGIDKQLVGRVAADIRSYYPAEPYKGKGIKYTGEKIRRKEGKTVA